MEKKNISGYIIAHKPVEYGIWDDEIYTPLQVGNMEETFCPLRDNTGQDNIAQWNNFFAEGTGTYWIWKNHPETDYILHCQYRRRLDVHNVDVNEIFDKGREIVCARPLNLAMPLWKQYCRCHSKMDMDIVKSIFYDTLPEWKSDFKRVIERGSIMCYSNGFIMKSEEYEEYCRWLFSILFEYMDRRNFSTPDSVEEITKKDILEGTRKGTRGWRYQCQIGGFLSERLFTLWLLSRHQSDRIAIMDYTKYEGV